MLLNLRYLVCDNLLLMKNLLFCGYLVGSRYNFSDLSMSVWGRLGRFLKLRGILLHFRSSAGHLNVRDQLFVKHLRVSNWTCFFDTTLDV